MLVPAVVIELHIEENLTTRQFAEYVGFHPNYFATLFRKHTGFSFKEYITELRVQRAKDFLETKEYKISDIAYMCGFNDTFYFSKVFKKSTGITPSEYMNNSLIPSNI